MGDLIIFDEFYFDVGMYIRLMNMKYEQILEEYVRILNSIKNQGICQGETAEALEMYINLAKNMGSTIKALGNVMDSAMHNYIESIDKKDTYIF